MKTSNDARMKVDHEFVEFLPNELKQGTLYVSLQSCTVAHKCLCGCGGEVYTPLSPAGWALTFDGDTISLNHSIGSSSLPCQSHYWIERSTVKWARRMSKGEIDGDRARDRRANEEYFRNRTEARLSTSSGSTESQHRALANRGWRKIKKWLGFELN